MINPSWDTPRPTLCTPLKGLKTCAATLALSTMETNQEAGFSGPATPVGHSENVLGLTQGSLRTPFQLPPSYISQLVMGCTFRCSGELWISIIRATFKKPQTLLPQTPKILPRHELLRWLKASTHRAAESGSLLAKQKCWHGLTLQHHLFTYLLLSSKHNSASAILGQCHLLQEAFPGLPSRQDSPPAWAYH